MELILDTNALSGIADGDVMLEPILRRAIRIAVPVIVLGEYRYVVRQSRRRAVYEKWLNEALLSYSVLGVDEATAVQYAEVRDELKRKGRPIPQTTPGSPH